MQVRNSILWAALLATVALSACGRGDKEPHLMNLRSQTAGPDEFSILPTKPLEMPEDISALPEPTPGGTNLTDPTPEADAIAVLGGNPDATKIGKISGGNASLLAQATRFGTNGQIRQVLAEEDLQYRRENDGRLLERLFNVNVYYRAYAPMSLDQHQELARWRKKGVQTVGAPPSDETPQ
ncbi:MAG: DUF3035 domain-containing protein [Paracoccaceae bacterium]